MQKGVVVRWVKFLTVCLFFSQFTDVFGSKVFAVTSPLTLAWEAAPDPTITGYAIYYGPTNQSFLARLDAGTNLTCTITDLIPGLTYRLYAVSYNADGVESAPSNEVVFTVTASDSYRPAITILRYPNGAMQLDWTMSPGANARVLYAADPQSSSWATLHSVTADGAGRATWTDSTAPTVNRRFYRVVIP